MLSYIRYKTERKKKQDNKKSEIVTDKSMVLKVISKYGFFDCQIIRCGYSGYQIYVKHKNKIHGIGTAKVSADNRWVIDKLDNRKLRQLE